MLKLLLAFLILTISSVSLGQAIPCTAIEIPNTDTCISLTHNQIGVPGSGFLPNCGNYIGGDVCFHTTVPASGYIQIEAEITSTLNSDMDMAI